MSNVWKIVIGIAILLLLIVIYLYLSKIIFYIIIAGLVSLLGRPLMRFLHHFKIGKFHIPVHLSALTTIAVFFALIVGYFWLFLPMLMKQLSVFAEIDFQQVLLALETPMTKLDSYLTKISPGNDLKSSAEIVADTLAGVFDFNKVTTAFGSIIGTLGDIVIAIFSITFISFFFLVDKSLFYNFTLNFIPINHLSSYDHVITKSRLLLTRYIIGIIIQVSVVTLLVFIGCTIIDIDNALLIGFFAGLVNIIPYVGPIIGMIFGLIITITLNLDLAFYPELTFRMLQVVVLFLTVQMIDNFIIQPYIFSNSVKAHPLEIFLVILIAGTLAGIPGMIMAIPSYTILRVVAQTFLSEFTLVRNLTKNF